MNGCETHEAALSAWLDGALDREEGLALVDHLVRCGDCREFYLDARALDGAVGVLRAGHVGDERRESRTEADDMDDMDDMDEMQGLWRQIERKAGRSAAPRARQAWPWRAAAVLVLGLGLAGFWWSAGRREGAAPSQAGGVPAVDEMIALGTDAGRMTKARFLDLTGEILRADPRYHAEMYRVMRQVVEETTAGEMASDVELAGDARGERPVGETLRRDPV